VVLFLEHFEEAMLTLHLPCNWNEKSRKFHDNGSKDWQTNPGHTANHYHDGFSRTVGRDTLLDIETAKLLGATLDTSHRGFHARNTYVARSQYLIAFTFGTGDVPKDGGTKYTWSLSHAIKVHVPLQSLTRAHDTKVKYV